MQRQAATLVDQVVPHAKPAHLRLAKVVGAQNAGHIVLMVNEDKTFVRLAGGAESRGVDDGELALVVLIFGEVQLLLHCRDVGLGPLHVKSRCGLELRIWTNVSLDEDHVLVGDVGVLLGSPLVVLRPGHTVLVVLFFCDEERRCCKTSLDLGLVVEVAELCLGNAGHVLQHPTSHFCLGGVDGD